MKPSTKFATLTSRLLIFFALISFLLPQRTQAIVTDPQGYFVGGNTAEGQAALLSLSGGIYNTAVGWFSLKNDTSGSYNTGVGAGTLPVNTADRNTATGTGALFNNTLGADNTADGTFALFTNIGSYRNTAMGVDALGSNFLGYENTAAGYYALVGNTYGVRNTATGVEALFSNVAGNYNTATGFQALHSNNNIGGSYNTAIGGAALYNNTSGGGNIGVGFNAGANNTVGNLNIDIGNTGSASDSNTMRLGTQEIQIATYVAGIFGATIPDGVPVYVATDGKLGTVISSARFKEDIKPMDKASKAILALKPVMFHYKTDSKGVQQFGLIAEEVAQVNPDLVVRDEKGEIYTVRYEAVNAMLLNEFLKEHRKVEEQQATIAELRSTVGQQRKDFQATAAEQREQIQALMASLQEQAMQIQKVSAQIELERAAPRTVLKKP